MRLTALAAPFALAALAFAAAVRAPGRSALASRVLARLRVSAVGAALWPAVALLVTDDPLSLAVALFVEMYLCQEVRALSRYRGPADDYDSAHALSGRVALVAQVAFAMGALLMSDRSDPLMAGTRSEVFLALVLCLLSAVPTEAAGAAVGAPPEWLAARHTLLSYALGIMSMAAARAVF